MTSVQPKKFHEFLVLLDDQAVRQVEKAKAMPMGLKRREFVAETLINNMMKTQQPLWDVLDGLKDSGHVDPKKAYQPLWIQNAIIVHGDDTAEQVMSSAAGVAQAIKSANHTLETPPFEVDTFADPAANKSGKGKGQGLMWNVERMKVMKAWADGITGKGVKVGSIDTGVDVSHPALLAKYAGYNPISGSIDNTSSWFDATGESPDKPVDAGRHGTHTVGTVLGSYGGNRTGMAPNAKFIAARGLGEKGGTDGMLLRSFQFMAAPRVPTPGTSPGSRRDLTLGVDLINNSWGSTDGLSTSYMNALRNMAAMGIVNIFSAGNDGQGGKAGSLGSPASSPDVISVAATDRKDKIAEFSSRGPNPLPSPDGEPSPFVSAPGVDIYSTIPGGRFETGWQGTSMSGPAVAGLSTLILDVAQQETGAKFDVYSVKAVLKKLAEDIGAKGVDDVTGYGIPTAENLRSVVKQVAIDRGLMKKPSSRPDKPKVAPEAPKAKAPAAEPTPPKKTAVKTPHADTAEQDIP